MHFSFLDKVTYIQQIIAKFHYEYSLCYPVGELLHM